MVPPDIFFEKYKFFHMVLPYNFCKILNFFIWYPLIIVYQSKSSPPPLAIFSDFKGGGVIWSWCTFPLPILRIGFADPKTKGGGFSKGDIFDWIVVISGTIRLSSLYGTIKSCRRPIFVFSVVWAYKALYISKWNSTKFCWVFKVSLGALNCRLECLGPSNTGSESQKNLLAQISNRSLLRLLGPDQCFFPVYRSLYRDLFGICQKIWGHVHKKVSQVGICIWNLNWIFRRN